MLLLITGSRDISKRGLEYARAAVRRAFECQHAIIVGDASGVDEAVMNECHKLGVPCTVVGAYNKLRRHTPTCNTETISGSYTERDRYMVGRCDACLAIWNGKSRGTKYTYDCAVKYGKQAWLKTFTQ
jgi:predicted Rossmann fold nucleotide-binding protein DprA/Smf involved in DNA uptake